MGDLGQAWEWPSALPQQLSVPFPQLLVLGAAKFNFASAAEQLRAASEEQQPRGGYVLSLFSPAWLSASDEGIPKEDKPALTRWERQKGQRVPALAAGARL